MRIERYISLSLVFVGLMLFTACEKAEQPIAKPMKGAAEIARIHMGEDYADQVFFDFASRQSVMVSKANAWDLAFEAGPDGYHVFMNGGKDLLLYNTRNVNAAAITEMDALNVEDRLWGFDGPSGLPDSTYVGDWRNKNETFLVRFNDGSFKKVVFASVADSGYLLKFGDINSTSLQTIFLPKDASFNYVYFSFDNGGRQVYPEPAKHTWDIVFTRYRFIYYELANTRYVVTGVLLNPHNTRATADSTTAFSDITFNPTSMQQGFSNRRDFIGFDWKTYNFTTGLYQTNTQKTFLIRTQQNQHWKMRFLDFYANGIKGSPSFEFERIQ